MTANGKTFFLMAILTALFVYVGGMVGGSSGALLAFVFAAGMNLYSYWFSADMVLKRYRASEIGPEHPSGLYQLIERLASQGGLPMPRVFVVPESTPNAFATGRNPENAAVAATEGILRLLDRGELEGVMAHELAHIRNRDMLTGTIAATFAGALTMLGQFGRFAGGSGRNRNPLGGLLLVIGAPLAAMFLRMAISRTREYAADRGGAEISANPLGLANALHKLQHGVAKYPIETGRPSDSHLFIVNPFLGGLSKLFSTHPPIEERIRRLESMAERGDY